MDKTVSIIIPTYNEATNIIPIITDIQRKSQGLPVEVIVVDAQSTDTTTALALSAGAKVYVSEVKSRAEQMNLGAARATGEILYFVHADTRVPEGFLQDIHTALNEGYSSGCYRFKFDSERILLKINSFFTRFDTLSVRGGDQTLFITRHLFEEIGGFDPSFVIMEEYDFIQKIWRKNRSIFKLIPKNVLVSARKYEKNTWLRVQIANLVAMMSFRMGIAPMVIAKNYKQMLY